MNQKIQIKDIYGTPYQRGLQSGSFFENRVDINLDGIVSFMNNHKEAVDQMHFSSMQLQKEYPEYYEEMIGKADGLKTDRDVYMMLMHPEILAKGHESCSTIMVRNADGTFSLYHNEDDVYRKGNVSFVRVHTHNGWFITNDMYNMPFGNGVIIHQSGLVRCINYCFDQRHDGFSRYFCQRHIAEASSYDELKSRAHQMIPSSGYHVNVIDHDHAFSMEVRHDDIYTKEVSDVVVHTNHFMYDIPRNSWNEEPLGNSIFRYEKIIREMEAGKDYEEILSMHTDDPMTSIFQCHSNANRTLFRFIYDGCHHTCSITEFEQGNTITIKEAL